MPHPLRTTTGQNQRTLKPEGPLFGLFSRSGRRVQSVHDAPLLATIKTILLLVQGRDDDRLGVHADPNLSIPDTAQEQRAHMTTCSSRLESKHYPDYPEKK